MPEYDLSVIGKITETTYEYNWKDVVLYAVGIGTYKLKTYSEKYQEVII